MDPVSVVLNDDGDVAVLLADSNLDAAAPGRELDRIVHQIPHHLLQPPGVRQHAGRLAHR